MEVCITHEYISKLLQVSKFERAYQLIVTYDVNPFYICNKGYDTLFIQVLETMKMHSSSMYNGNGLSVLLRTIMLEWIKKYSKYIDVTQVYKRNNANILICTGIFEVENKTNLLIISGGTISTLPSRTFCSASIPLTLLNLACYLGDVEFFNLLIEIFGDKVIKLIQQE